MQAASSDGAGAWRARKREREERQKEKQHIYAPARGELNLEENVASRTAVRKQARIRTSGRNAHLRAARAHLAAREVRA